MGNSESSSCPSYIAEQVEWKSGNIPEGVSVPYPSTGPSTLTANSTGPYSTYEDLQGDSGLKEFILRNIDTDFVSSFVSSAAADSESLLKGLPKLQAQDPELLEEIRASVARIELCVTAGVNVKAGHIKAMFDKQLDVNFKCSNELFISAFQRRLLCLHLLKVCLERERDDAMTTVPPSKPDALDLSPAEQSQLMILAGLKNAGLGLLRVFPVCIAALTDQSQRDLLVQPIKLLCEHLSSMGSLQMVSSCRSHVLDQIHGVELDVLSKARIQCSASTDGASAATNLFRTSPTSSGWSCSGGYLILTMEQPQNVSWITMSWARESTFNVVNPSNNMTEKELHTSPQRIMMFAKILNLDGEEVGPQLVQVCQPAVVYAQTNSWRQHCDFNLQRVTQLRFFFSAASEDSPTGLVELYGLRVYLSEDATQPPNLKTIPLLGDIQQALIPLSCYPDTAKESFDAHLAIVRGTGSLSLLLVLMHTLLDSGSDADIMGQSLNSVTALLKTIYSTEKKIRDDLNAEFSSTGRATDVRFTKSDDENPESSAISCKDALTLRMANVLLESGVYEWEVTITEEVRGDESIFIGVCPPAARAESVLTSDAYLVRCYNGELFHGKRCVAVGVVSIHCGDVCRFRFDQDHSTLALWVNNIAQGIIFEFVPSGLIPCVLFQRSIVKKSVKIGNMVRILSYVKHSSSKELVPDRPEPSLELLNGESFLPLLIAELQCLSSTVALSIQTRETAALVSAFCVEISVSAFAALVSLIKRVHDKNKNSKSSVGTAMLTCLLSLLDLHFLTVTYSRIDPTDLGFHTKRRESPQVLKYFTLPDPSIDELDFEAMMGYFTGRLPLLPPHGVSHQLFREMRTMRVIYVASIMLQSFLGEKNVEFLTEATLVFGHGLELLVPSTEERMQLAVQTLKVMDAAFDLSSESTLVEKSYPCTLLVLLLKHLKAPKEVLKLLSLAAESTVHADQVATFTVKLINLMTRPGFDQVNVDSSCGFSIEDMESIVLTLLSTFQQHLMYDLVHSEESTRKMLSVHVLLPYAKNLVISSTNILGDILSPPPIGQVGESIIPESVQESHLRNSIVGTLLHPLLYALTLSGIDSSFYENISAELFSFLAKISETCCNSEACRIADELVNSVIPTELSLMPATKAQGWRTINAVFEESDGTFVISENGTLYSSSSTSNTCAVVAHKFSARQKGAWEFLLQVDSAGDECSVFGAARAGFSNRCYSSSPDLYMRRAYNGYLYELGSHNGSADKIKPGDVVRIEYDGPAKTISYGVNGDPMEIAFTGVTDDIYPACGSYRSNVGIRLLKVEEFGATDSDAKEAIDADYTFALPSADVSWVLSEESNMTLSNPAVLSPSGPKGTKPKTPVSRWVTARANKGAVHGVHEWSFYFSASHKTPYAVGVVSGGNPYPFDRLGGPCLKISSKTPKTCAVPGSTVRLDGSAGFMSAPPIAQSNATTARTAPSSPSFPTDTQETVTAVVGADTIQGSQHGDVAVVPAEQQAEVPLSRTYRYPPEILALAWHSDGSLWHNGCKVFDEFGSAFLPLKKGMTISVRVNRTEKIVNFFVNGKDAGIAFGPEGSGAAYTVALPCEPDMSSCSNPSSLMLSTVFPAASVASSLQSIAIKSAGFNGSTIIPLQLNIQKTVVSLIGRISAVLIQGPPVSIAEVNLIPWFASNLMISGVEEKDTMNSAVSEQSDNSQSQIKSFLEDLMAFSAEEIDSLPCPARERVQNLLSWLETIDPEPRMLQTALERTKTYRFPVCEVPFLSCLLKHSGLANEALKASESFGTTESASTPSTDMVRLWQRIKQLRVFLRQRRQALKTDEVMRTSVQEEALERSASSITEASDALEMAQNSPHFSVSHRISLRIVQLPVFIAGWATVKSHWKFTPVYPLRGDDCLVEDKWQNNIAVSANYISAYVSKEIEWRFSEEDGLKPWGGEGYLILAWGIDSANELIYIKLMRRSGYQRFVSSGGIRLNFDGDALFPSDWHYEVLEGNLCSGRAICVRFDYSSLRRRVSDFRTNTKPVSVVLGANCAQILLPGLSDDVLFEREGESEKECCDFDSESGAKFKALCECIRDRALFLMKLNPAALLTSGSDYQSRAVLRTVTKRFSGVLPASGENEELARWRAQDRWKRVLGYLHAKSRSQKISSNGCVESTSSKDFRPVSLNRTVSASTSNIARIFSDFQQEQDVSQEEEDNPVLAALQACTVFTITEAAGVTPSVLDELLITRKRRAELRVLGFKLLSQVLSMKSIRANPLYMSPLLCFLKPAMSVSLPKSVSADNIIRGMCSKVHYLNNLEGNSAFKLMQVQEAFADLYMNLASILSEHVKQMHATGSTNGQYISPCMILKREKNQPHILSDSISSLLEVWTVHFSSRDHRLLQHSGVVECLQKLTSLSLQEQVELKWLEKANSFVSFLRANSHYFSLKNNLLWSPDAVRLGLENGSITAVQLLHHICSLSDPELRYGGEEGNQCSSQLEFVDMLEHAENIEEKYLTILCRATAKTEAAEKERLAQEQEKAKMETDLAVLQSARFEPCGVFDSENRGRLITLSSSNREASIADDGTRVAMCAYANIEYSAESGTELTGNYFEVTIIAVGRKAIGVGLANRNHFAPTRNMPGWENHSYGYHGDDGKKFGVNSTPGDWPLFETGDVVGCGIDFERSAIFYTLNGEFLGDGFLNVQDRSLWPVVGFSNRHRLKEHVKINFGLEPFAYSGSEVRGHPRALQERIILEAEALVIAAAKVVKEQDKGIAEGGRVDSYGDAASVVSRASYTCSSQEDFSQRIRLIEKDLKAAEALKRAHEACLESAELVLGFFMTSACYADRDRGFCETAKEEKSVQSYTVTSTVVSSTMPGIAIPTLTKEVSMFGTPLSLTEPDSSSLQRKILGYYCSHIITAAYYLCARCASDKRSIEKIETSCENTGETPLLMEPINDRIVLDDVKISKRLRRCLIYVAMQVDAWKDMNNALLQRDVIRALFMITEQRLKANRDLAFRLLNKILPIAAPDLVQESIPSHWNTLIQEFDINLQEPMLRKRFGKMPCAAILALLLTTAGNMTATNSHAAVDKFNFPVYGQGTSSMELASCKLQLLQTLFAAPHWTELVACAITDSFYNASLVISQLDAMCTFDTASTEIHDAADLQVLRLACASLSVLSFLSVCRSGSRARFCNNEPGIVLGLSEVLTEWQCVSDNNLLDFDPNRHMFSVAHNEVESVFSVVDVQLSELSQPLLQEFFGLVEKLLRARKISNKRIDLLIRRLATTAVLTLSQLLDSQCEIMDHLRDTDIISDITSLALCSSQLPFIPTFRELLQIWQVANMRYIEVQSVPIEDWWLKGVEQTKMISSDIFESNSIATLEIPTTFSDVIAQLSTELSVPPLLCKLFVDFHGGNENLARSSISNAQQNDTICALLANIKDLDELNVSASERPSYDDSNVLKRTGAIDSSELTESNNQAIRSDLSNTQMHLLSVHEFIRRMNESVPTLSPVVLITESELDGEVAPTQGSGGEKLVYVSIDELRKRSECSHMLVREISQATGFQDIRILDQDVPIRAVTSLMRGIKFCDLNQSMVELDRGVLLHGARSITTKLLVNGNLHLQRDLSKNNQKQWGNLVKMLSVGEDGCLDQIIYPLCMAMLQPGARELEQHIITEQQVQLDKYILSSSQEAVLDNLVQDVVAGFTALSDVKLNSSTASEETWEETLQCASPHPFPAPHHVLGVVNIPPSWQNICVQFHPFCSTPSPRAQLQFFQSMEDVANSRPLFKASGLPRDWDNIRCKSINGPIQQLYYTFIADSGSDITPHPLVALTGTAMIDGCTCAVGSDASGGVGLGVDDSLFNLFNTEADPEQGPTSVSINIPGMTSGTWFYEVQVTASIEADLLKCAVGLVSDDFISSSDILTSECALYIMGDASGKRGDCALMAHNLGEWQSGDFLTFLVRLAGDMLQLLVSRNGILSDVTVCATRTESTTGWRPFFIMDGTAKFDINQGERSLVFPVSGALLHPDSEHPSRPIAFANNEDNTIKNAWGYHFCVRPQRQLRVRLCTEFTLVKKINAESSEDGVKALWIWRPIALDGFLPWGDVATTTQYPPNCTVLVDKSQCRPPIASHIVIGNAKVDFAVHRLEPPAGFVALGDMLSPTFNGTPSFETKSLCVPEWAVQEGEATSLLYSIKKTKDSTCGTLWNVAEGLGAFRSSAFDCRHGSTKSASNSSTTHRHGVGKVYVLTNRTELSAIIQSEWSTEADIVTMSSLRWTTALMRNLLNSPISRERVLTPDLFTKVVQYLKSSHSLKPFVVIPLLIQMIRLAQTNQVKLPLDTLKDFCKAILTQALTAYKGKNNKIPLAMMKLVDLVVEVQVTQIEESVEKHSQFSQYKKYVACADYHDCVYVMNEEESKDEDGGSGAIESKQPDFDDGSGIPPMLCRLSSDGDLPDQDAWTSKDLSLQLAWLAKQSRRSGIAASWWNRDAIPPILLKLHRGVKSTVVPDLYRKISSVMELRQILKFINALEQTFSPTKTLHDAMRSRSLPHFMTAKVWSGHASATAVEESQHPYRLDTRTRKIDFPGAQKLHVTFDRRCALAPGDVLAIKTNVIQSGKSSQNPSTIFQLTSATTEATLIKGVTIHSTDCVVFEFLSENSTVNVENYWGWSCSVHVVSGLYESADTVIDISDESLSVQSVTSQQNVFRFNLLVDQLKKILPTTADSSTVLTQTLEKMRSVNEINNTEFADLRDTICGLVCTGGQLLCDGSIGTPLSHAMELGVEVQEGKDSIIVPGNLIVLQGYSFNSESSTECANAGDKLFRIFIDAGHGHTELPCSGDTIHYKVYWMNESDFLDRITPLLTVATSESRDTVKTVADVSVVDRRARSMSGDSTDFDVDDIFGDIEPTRTNMGHISDTLGSSESIYESVEEEGEDEAAHEETEVVADSMWACEVCTLLNPPHVFECSVCTSPRPTSSIPPALLNAPALVGRPEGGGPAVTGTPVGWWCGSCTYINGLSQTSCEMCGSARDQSGEEDENSGEDDEDDDDEEEARNEEPDLQSNDDNSTSTSYMDEDVDDEEGDDLFADLFRSRSADDENAERLSREARRRRVTFQPGTSVIDDASRVVGVASKEKGQRGTLSSSANARLIAHADKRLLILTVTGKFHSHEMFEARLLGALASAGDILTPAQMSLRQTEWTAEADIELIDQMNNMALSSLPIYQFSLPRKFLTYCCSNLATKNLLDVQCRILHIEEFNKHLEHLLPVIDLGNSDPHSLGSRIRRCSRYLLLKLKTPLLESAISNSVVSSGKGIPAPLSLDNSKALHSRDREDRDITTSQNCFVQAFNQLNSKDSNIFRCAAGSDRVFQTSFTGESGIDAGGVFREAMSRIVEDLFSENFNLLLLCPNAQQVVHSNMEKYLPNPQHIATLLGLQMFRFIGKLMALSIRTKLYLPFEFPPIIWKKLVGEDVGIDDLMGIDAITTKQMESVRSWDLEKVDPEKLKFEYLGSDKVERELIPGGRLVDVTFENRGEYCDAVLSARLGEFDAAVAAMSAGMEEVIPTRAVLLFSGAQLEELVCGSPTFDLELWRKNTDSTGVSAKTIQLFWEVMGTLTQKELSGFVRFAWGRSRLPPAKEFTVKMRLTSGGSAVLPVSHTCFFSVELPEYQTEEKMRHGLLTAIHYGVGGILNG